MSGLLPVEYATEPRKPRDSAWSLIGFALALVVALASAASWWNFWRSARGGATTISFGVSPLYYALAAAVAGACVAGIVRGRRRFGVLGLVFLVAAVVSMVVLVAGSPWATGARPAGIPWAGR